MKKPTEEKLKASEERYRSLFEAANDAILVMDGDRFVECNRKTLKMFGCVSEQILNETPYRFSPPRQPDGRDSREKAFELIAAAYEGRPQSFEWRHCRHDGTLFDAEVSLTRLELFGRRQLFAIVRDIAERKRAEEALRESEQRFSTTFHSNPDAVAITRLEDGTFLDVNEGFERTFGISRQEAIGRTSLELDFWADPANRADLLGRLETGESVRDIECQYRRRSGEILIGLYSGELIDLSGERCLLSVVKDITKRKQVEEALRDSERKLHAIFDHHHQLTGLLGPKGRILAINATALRFAGTEESEVIGRYFWDSPWWDRSQQPIVRDAIERAAGGEFVRFETTNLAADGEARDVDFLLSPVQDDDGNVVYLVPEGRDITERREAESRLSDMETQLAHVSRLSTIGEMIAGIGHEVNQPLYAIRNFARAMQNLLEAKDPPDLNALREWNAAISSAADRAAEMLNRMRGFARRGESVHSMFSINDIVYESVQLVAFEARRTGAAVRLELPERSPTVHVDRVQIQQVLVNLLRNAFETMDESESEVREVTIRVEPAEESVQVSVADTGPGLPAHEDLNIFEPFVTDREDGLGLGLAISSSIIEAHDGRLRADSAAAGGAAFQFTLPAFQKESTDGE